MPEVCLVTVVHAADCLTAAEMCGCIIFRIYYFDIASLFNLLLGVRELMLLALICEFYDDLVASRCVAT